MNAEVIIKNTSLYSLFEKWLNDNDIHSYGKNYGYMWVSWNGKLGNKVYDTNSIFNLFIKTAINNAKNIK